jgi:hypothetical protein
LGSKLRALHIDFFYIKGTRVPILKERVERMTSTRMEKFEGAAISDEIVATAAKLFSENYGVCGPLAEGKMGRFAKQGTTILFPPMSHKF